MKHLCFLIAALMITTTVFAQAPQKMSYQAVIRDSANILVANTTLGMQISILQGSATGTPVFVETQTPTTNINGLVTFEIGAGTPVAGTFATINWNNSPYFIKTETDLNGGTNYTITGTSELLSVPYALYAESVNPNSITSINAGGEGKIIVVYTTSNAYGFYQNVTNGGFWTSTSLNGTTLGAAAAIDMVVVYTSSNAYGFYQNSNNGGFWTSTPLNGTPFGIVASKNAIVVYTSSNAYGFYQNSSNGGFWVSTPLNGTPLGALSSGDNIVVYTSSNAYGFYQNMNSGGFWTSTSLNGTPAGIINGK